MCSFPRVATWLSACLLIGSLAGCSSSSSSGGVVRETLVTVAPSSLDTRPLVCANVTGAWKRYVVTLTDVTDPEHPVQLPSSGPVSCTMPVSFSNVTVGHAYLAAIDAYDRADIGPGEGKDGSPTMVDPKGREVAPRWHADCGTMPVPVPSGDGGAKRYDYEDVAAISRYATSVLVGNCDSFEEINPPENSTTAIEIDLQSVLGRLSCEQDIDHFDVVPRDSSLPSTGASCGETVLYRDLEPKQRYEFTLRAFSKNAPSPRWGTTCSAETVQGLILPAQCFALTTRGALRVDGAVVAGSEPCRLRAVLVGSDRNATTLQHCDRTITFRGLEAGAYEVVLDSLDPDGTPKKSAICQGIVKPGELTDARCAVGSGRD